MVISTSCVTIPDSRSGGAYRSASFSSPVASPYHPDRPRATVAGQSAARSITGSHDSCHCSSGLTIPLLRRRGWAADHRVTGLVRSLARRPLGEVHRGNPRRGRPGPERHRRVLLIPTLICTRADALRRGARRAVPDGHHHRDQPATRTRRRRPGEGDGDRAGRWTGESGLGARSANDAGRDRSLAGTTLHKRHSFYRRFPWLRRGDGHSRTGNWNS